MRRENMIKLNLGCGIYYKPGYINIDKFESEIADEIADICHLQYEDNSVDEIEASHIIEHFDVITLPFLIAEWFRVLKPIGKLIIEAPDFNKGYFKTHRVARPEELRFKGDRGDEVQGWILKPPNFNRKRKYPLIVQIHGGPFAAYGNSLFHEFQVLAANGYVVFYSNPHGSQGYGEKFAKALHNRWGIPDTKDILKAVKLLTRRRYIDQTRMGVMGGSYGGFMTNWIIGHTNMFKVAVTMRSVVNMLSFFSSD